MEPHARETLTLARQPFPPTSKLLPVQRFPNICVVVRLFVPNTSTAPQQIAAFATWVTPRPVCASTRRGVRASCVGSAKVGKAPHDLTSHASSARQWSAGDLLRLAKADRLTRRGLGAAEHLDADRDRMRQGVLDGGNKRKERRGREGNAGGAREDMVGRDRELAAGEGARLVKDDAVDLGRVLKRLAWASKRASEGQRQRGSTPTLQLELTSAVGDNPESSSEPSADHLRSRGRESDAAGAGLECVAVSAQARKSAEQGEVHHNEDRDGELNGEERPAAAGLKPVGGQCAGSRGGSRCRR